MNTQETSLYISLLKEIYSALIIMDGISVEEKDQEKKNELMAAIRKTIFDVVRRHIDYAKAQLALPD